MKRTAQLRGMRRGFTLTELLVVFGLIAMLIALIMPVMTKAKAAASATACMSNLRQMGQAWEMYTAENRGRLMEYNWFTPTSPDLSWKAYWLGILDSYKVRGDVLLCPSAKDVIPYNINKGFGNITYAWTGKYQTLGTMVHFNAATYRNSSYGYNKYLVAPNLPTVTGGFGARITSVRRLWEVPVFMDSTFVDFEPNNKSEATPVDPPPNLRGQNIPAGAPDHWRFLIARHGRGVNAYMADGSARWVPLEETYMLSWKSDWKKYLLRLPKY